MNYRKEKYKSKNRNLIISISSLFIVLCIAVISSDFIARAIYNESFGNKVVESDEKEKVTDIRNDISNLNYSKESEIELNENYSKSLSDENLILFQGGVFTDLENAEEFSEEIEDKAITTIVSDNKYERIMVGLTNKEYYLETIESLKDNKVQFVKQVYKIPMHIKYNEEILDITNKVIAFINENPEIITESVESDILKEEVEKIDADYGEVDSFKMFNEYKELIMELDKKITKDDIGLVIDFIYSNFKNYKV